ncbi:MAG: hypothetical protein ABR972_15945, partial [Acidimicrobiales bacterium]
YPAPGGLPFERRHRNRSRSRGSTATPSRGSGELLTLACRQSIQFEDVIEGRTAHAEDMPAE